MITVTKVAAEQIKSSARQGKTEGLALRIAAKRNNDGSIHYGMGFDDKTEHDQSFKSEDIEIIVAPDSMDLLDGTELDFVELDDGQKNFISKNPNDPNFNPESNAGEHHF